MPAFLRTSLRCSTTLFALAALLSTAAHATEKKKPAEARTESKNVPSYYGPQPSTENLDLTMYARIRAEGLQHGKVMDFGAALADGIGPRLTGSPNMAKANAWTRDTLSKIGLENAHLEDWGEFGMGWQQINTWARMVSPDPEPLWMQAAPWSPATKGPVTGEIVYVPLADAEELDKLHGTLAGKIVLLGAMRPTPDITEPLFHRYTDEELKDMENAESRRANAAPAVNIQTLMAERQRLAALRQRALKMMIEEGVAAIITPSRDGGNGGGTGIIFDDNGANLIRGAQTMENAVKIPNAVMMIEHYNRLARMAQAHVPVTVEVNIETKFTGDHEHGFDTVAEIPGSDLKDQVVMVGGHLDSWISGTGATDNGAGSIVAMEAVRILKALDLHPRRTIRIALWSGEEEGLFGSQGYVKQHFGTFAAPATPDPVGTPSYMSRNRGPLQTTKEWETLDAYYNLDNGTGKVRGVYTQENFAIAPIFAQWIAPLHDLGVTTISNRNTGGTDHLSFDAVGLPGFQFIQDPLDYETRTHHSDMDTYDRLHQADLEQAAIVEAIFLWNTSQRDEMMPRKPFPHPELEKQLSAPIPGLYPNAVEPAK
ncbi:M20/M25/M40 family metallo-hydrolase [Granulicella mallensis]|uniref:Carboxypeptidase Q n=1 Tax=Granulicella mallensis (strain ATCC BAA-1857 / DSM 23137 / MP5ACTX8) TaxID=682795 RepID=G8NZM3_GRAMM|nr:M20/M25/M40 family metallo-hydrolase [Granulicella mallensis]AEU39143.1 peptidase M28 [Granulicella mallensis MP5ACTX8]